MRILKRHMYDRWGICAEGRLLTFHRRSAFLAERFPRKPGVNRECGGIRRARLKPIYWGAGLPAFVCEVSYLLSGVLNTRNADDIQVARVYIL